MEVLLDNDYDKDERMKLYKIVLTGGPCAGKTTALSWIQNAFSQKGYTVVFIPETASEIIPSGLTPETAGRNIDYQKCEVELQLAKERIYERGVRTMNADKVLLVCDRGVIDDKAYMSPEDFEEVLKFVGANEIALRDSYDAVFHMVTAAKGAQEFYTTLNNIARTETAEEAVALDDATIAAWTGHHHLRIIHNTTDFDLKLKRTIAEIASFLGEPGPLEIERRYVIEYPDITWLESTPACCKVEITQTYHRMENGEMARICKRGIDGHYIYYLSTKRRVRGGRGVEVERRLNPEEYSELTENETDKRVKKTRYCLTYKNQCFEIDVYPDMKDKAEVWIELADANDEVHFPDEIKVIREITGENVEIYNS